MKHFVLFFVFVLSCSSHKKILRPFYYRISDGEKTYLVLGTMHLGVSLKDLPPQVRTDLDQSQALVVEYDEASRVKLNSLLKKKRHDYLWSHARTEFALKESLSPEAWKKLIFMLNKAEPTDFILKSGISYPYEKIHPAFIGIMTNHFIQQRKFYLFAPGTFSLRSRYYFMTMSDELEESLDKEILSEARQKKIPVVSLGDTSEKMVDENINFERSALTYLEGVFGFENPAAVKKLERYHEDYRQGDEKKFLSNLEDVRRVELVGQKSAAWLSSLESIQGPQVFIALGALDLLGKDSLLEAFRKKGAQVSRVDLSQP